MKIPAGTRQGRTFRVKGQGITTGSSTGDLLVTVDVVVPSHLTDEQRKAVEALAEDAGRLAPTAPRSMTMAYEPTDPGFGERSTRAVYVISVAAELAGVHPQTLRIYERKGLLDPARTGGGNRRYSEADIAHCGASRSSPPPG